MVVLRYSSTEREGRKQANIVHFSYLHTLRGRRKRVRKESVAWSSSGVPFSGHFAIVRVNWQCGYYSLPGRLSNEFLPVCPDSIQL
jgi:hypothetical protein